RSNVPVAIGKSSLNTFLASAPHLHHPTGASTTGHASPTTPSNRIRHSPARNRVLAPQFVGDIFRGPGYCTPLVIIYDTGTLVIFGRNLLFLLPLRKDSLHL